MSSSRHQIERRFKRYPLPTALAVVSAEFRTDQGELPVGKLWDISLSGTCLVLPGRQTLAPGNGGLLLIHDPNSSEELALMVEVRWVDAANQVTFVGCQFVADLLPSGSFLDAYFKESWVDAMKVFHGEDFS
jgi:hypothetical protein